MAFLNFMTLLLFISSHTYPFSLFLTVDERFFCILCELVSFFSIHKPILPISMAALPSLVSDVISCENLFDWWSQSNETFQEKTSFPSYDDSTCSSTGFSVL